MSAPVVEMMESVLNENRQSKTFRGYANYPRDKGRQRSGVMLKRKLRRPVIYDARLTGTTNEREVKLFECLAFVKLRSPKHSDET